MSGNLSLIIAYREGLENHSVLREAFNDVAIIGAEFTRVPEVKYVAGMENFGDNATDLLKTGLTNLGSGLLSTGKWIGGQTLDLFVKGITAGGKALVKTFEGNNGLIKAIRQKATEGSYEFTLSVGQVASLTSTGHWKDFEHDLDALLHTVELTYKHGKAVQEHLNAQLVCLRKLKGVSSNDGILKIMDEYEKLVYPKFDLPERNGNTMLLSEVLPEGKVFKCNYDASAGKVEYSMSGDKPAGESSTFELSKSDLNTILGKLDKVNALHKAMKQLYDDYLTFMKSWSDMVKAVDTGLDKASGLSGHIKAEAEKHLGGDAQALAFYSGFCPRVVNYTDKYIHGVLGVLAKVI